jgi:hypothetical protein
VNSKATSRAVATRDGMPAANPRAGPQSWHRQKKTVRRCPDTSRLKEKLNDNKNKKSAIKRKVKAFIICHTT